MRVQLICMTFDGEYVHEGDFDSVNAAWEHSNNMGSRWYFYPFCFVLTKSGKTIKDAPEGLQHFIGKRIESVRRAFKRLVEKPEMANVSTEEFASAL